MKMVGQAWEIPYGQGATESQAAVLVAKQCSFGDIKFNFGHPWSTQRFLYVIKILQMNSSMRKKKSKKF